MVKTKTDFTSGPVLRKLLLFALPIIATNLLQVFYNAADMMVVSLSDEPNAVGAIGTTGAFIALVTNLFIGFSVGANVVIARHIGAKNKEDAERATHTALLMGLIFGTLFGALGLLLSRPVLMLIGNTGNVLDLATRYTFIYFLGIPFVSLTNVLASIFRARGDSRTPLIVLSLSGLANVGFNLFFVLVLGFSVEGVAIATVIANVLSTAVLTVKLTREKEYVTLSFKKLRINRRAFRDIFKIGVPSGIQGAFFSLSNMMIQSSIVTINNALTPDPNLSPVLNGNAAEVNLENFVYSSMSAVSHAASTFVSQNYGAKDTKRIKRGFFMSLGIVFVVCFSVSGVIKLLHSVLLSFYGVIDGVSGSVDAIAYETAVLRSLLVLIPYFICGLMEVGTSTIRSIGRPMTSFLITLFGACIFRILWTLFIFPLREDLVTLFVAYPISWLAAGIVAFVLVMVFVRNIERTTECVEL